MPQRPTPHPDPLVEARAQALDDAAVIVFDGIRRNRTPLELAIQLRNQARLTRENRSDRGRE